MYVTYVTMWIINVIHIFCDEEGHHYHYVRGIYLFSML